MLTPYLVKVVFLDVKFQFLVVLTAESFKKKQSISMDLIQNINILICIKLVTYCCGN